MCFNVNTKRNVRSQKKKKRGYDDKRSWHKKWTAMMLPEHVEGLRKQRKDDGKVKKTCIG
jgi:hypothetical protein